MKFQVFTFLFLCSINFGFAQNLVPNESFETIRKVPKHWMRNGGDFRGNISQWFSPTQGSPDILHINNIGKLIPDRPNVSLEEHRPRTGKSMIGIKTYGCKTRTLHCKEYLQVRLRAPLIPGIEYYGEFWVNPIATSINVHDIGMAFRDSAYSNQMSMGVYDVLPMIEQFEVLKSEPNEWIKISGNFKVDNISNFLLIGSFQEDDYVLTEVPEGALEYSYYLIDDVLVKPLEPVLLQDSISDNGVLVLNNVLFDHNKADLKPSSFKPLEQLSYIMNNDFSFNITIVGHTDNVGKPTQNKKLSTNRAESVLNFLADRGIEKERMKFVGKGEGEPVDSNETEEGKALNRRVEIVIEKVQ